MLLSNFLYVYLGESSLIRSGYFSETAVPYRTSHFSKKKDPLNIRLSVSLTSFVSFSHHVNERASPFVSDPPWRVQRKRCIFRRQAEKEPILFPRAGRLQKGGVPATPSGTATLLRLSPSHQFCLRPLLAVTDFRHPRLPWLDGRCVQGPGTYSPRHG